MTPLLKKTGLNSTDMSNSAQSPTFHSCPRQLSGQSSVSLRSTCLPTTFYLASSQHIERGTRLEQRVRVWSDVLMAADTQQVTLLAMLDLSAASDRVDHAILLQRLQFGVGLTDVVLEWISSFLSCCTLRNCSTSSIGINYGCTCTQMTVKCTSVRQPTMPLTRLPVCQQPSPTSTTG